MDIYNYFLNKEKWFPAKTPNSAITGIKKGVLPKESFISLSLFLYSPFETPGKLKILSEKEELQRIHELERILSKKKMDLETEVMLLYTLNKLVEHNNPEIALFAAESINSIENRYNKKIYNLKEISSNSLGYEELHDLITILYHYGYINAGKIDIQLYYFNEALKYFSRLNKSSIDISLHIINIKILIELNEFNKARSALDNIHKKDIQEWQKVLLLLEIEFKTGNFSRISTIIKTAKLDNIPDKYKGLVDQWKL